MRFDHSRLHLFIDGESCTCWKTLALDQSRKEVPDTRYFIRADRAEESGGKKVANDDANVDLSTASTY